MTDQTSTYAGYDPPQAGAVSAGDGHDPSAKEKAAQSAQAGTQAAAEVAQTAAGHAKEVAAEAQSQAKNLIGEASDQLRSHARDQHRGAVTNLRSLSDELRSMAEHSEQNGVASDLVGQAAERASGAADWLGNRQPEDLLDELRHLARRRPGAFLVGALVAGVVAGRLTRGVVAAHSDDADSGSTDSGNSGSGNTGSGTGYSATADARHSYRSPAEHAAYEPPAGGALA